MTWFTDWWATLSLLQQVFACFAVPATVILIIQTVLLIFGFGGHDTDHGEVDHDFSHDFDHDFDHDLDHDFDHDYDHDHDFGHAEHDGAHQGAGVRLISIRGFVAFFAVGGWLGIALIDTGLSVALSSIIAFIGGTLALLFVGFVLKLLYDMQESGNYDAKNAVAKTGRVYIRIPPKRSSTGKITLNVQGSLQELDAVTDSENDIQTGKMVQVVSVTADNILVVRPVE